MYEQICTITFKIKNCILLSLTGVGTVNCNVPSVGNFLKVHGRMYEVTKITYEYDAHMCNILIDVKEI